jgi:hypothetical protein
MQFPGIVQVLVTHALRFSLMETFSKSLHYMWDVVTQRSTSMPGNTLMIEPAASSHKQTLIAGALNRIGRYRYLILLTCI